MAIDRSNPEFIEKLQQIELEIAKKTKELILRLDSWRYLMFVISSYNGKPKSDSDCDFILTTQQATEVAFFYNVIETPETLVLIFQPKLYECLKNIGLNSVIITKSGIICNIKETNIYERYISSFSFKIPFAPILEEKLKYAIELCENIQIASISGQYDTYYEQTYWGIDEVHHVQYPVVKTRYEALTFNLLNQD